MANLDDVAENIRNERRSEVDRNPLIPCKRCHRSYSWRDYWSERLTRRSDPEKAAMWCDDCWADLRKRAERHRSMLAHQTLVEWGDGDGG